MSIDLVFKLSRFPINIKPKTNPFGDSRGPISNHLTVPKSMFAYTYNIETVQVGLKLDVAIHLFFM